MHVGAALFVATSKMSEEDLPKGAVLVKDVLESMVSSCAGILVE